MQYRRTESDKSGVKLAPEWGHSRVESRGVRGCGRCGTGNLDLACDSGCRHPANNQQAAHGPSGVHEKIAEALAAAGQALRQTIESGVELNEGLMPSVSTAASAVRRLGLCPLFYAAGALRLWLGAGERSLVPLKTSER